MEKCATRFSIIRFMPNLFTGQFLNIGILLVSQKYSFIGCQIEKDPSKLRWVYKDLDLEVYQKSVNYFLSSFLDYKKSLDPKDPEDFLMVFDHFTKYKNELLNFSGTCYSFGGSPEEQLNRAFDLYIRGIKNDE